MVFVRGNYKMTKIWPRSSPAYLSGISDHWNRLWISTLRPRKSWHPPRFFLSARCLRRGEMGKKWHNSTGSAPVRISKHDSWTVDHIKSGKHTFKPCLVTPDSMSSMSKLGSCGPDPRVNVWLLRRALYKNLGKSWTNSQLLRPQCVGKVVRWLKPLARGGPFEQ